MKQKCRFYSRGRLDSIYGKMVTMEMKLGYYTVIVNEEKKYINMTAQSILYEFKINITDVPLDETFLVCRRTSGIEKELLNGLNVVKYKIFKQRGAIYG